jgi:hypothetical protein
MLPQINSCTRATLPFTAQKTSVATASWQRFPIEACLISNQSSTVATEDRALDGCLNAHEDVDRLGIRGSLVF